MTEGAWWRNCSAGSTVLVLGGQGRPAARPLRCPLVFDPERPSRCQKWSTMMARYKSGVDGLI